MKKSIKKAPKKKVPIKIKASEHCAVPIATLARLIGQKNWDALVKFIKKKYPKTKFVLTGYTEQGPVLYAYPQAKLLGSLGGVMAKARIVSNPEPEYTPIKSRQDNRVVKQKNPIALESLVMKEGLLKKGKK